MGSSDNHDAFTGSAENAPKHGDAFTQADKDAPTGNDTYTISFSDHIAHHWSMKCDHEFKLMQRFMKSDSFDDLEFYNFETRQMMKGAELRGCQTGCEFLEKRGYHNSGIRCGIKDLKCGCKQFDEQLQFVNEEDKPLSNVDYCITRADGMKVKGTTDNEGKTKRIKNTQQEMAIEKVEFFATKWTQPLCPQNRIPIGTMLAEATLSDVRTTQINVGSSVKKVTMKGEDRPLTAGEIDMATLVFKNSINYGEVKVHKGKCWWTFGLQDDDTAMVPFGKMYFPKDKFSEDFSAGGKREDTYRIWFMHEMTHVWQHQLGMSIPVKWLELAIQGGYNYDNTGDPLPKGYRYDPASCSGKILPDFNFEQQAEIISHYYAARYLQDVFYSKRLVFLESVLKGFLTNPKDPGHLPREQLTPSPGVSEILKGGY